MNPLKCIGRFAAGALLMFSAASAAQVTAVKFDQQGGERLPEVQFQSVTRLRPGMEFDRDIVNADVKRLFNTGNYSDVVSEVRELGDDQVEVTFKIRLKPRIKAIKYQGNAKYSVADLSKHVNIAAGQRLRDADYAESLDGLRKFYTAEGYSDARIDSTLLPEPDGSEVTVIFVIDEQLKQRVNDVTFEGAELFSQWDLRHSIENRYSYWNWLPFVNDYLNHGLVSRPGLDLDRLRIREKYQEKGYLDVEVSEPVLTPDPEDPEKVNIQFTITEGEPYKVGKVSVSGNTKVKSEELLPLIQLTPDQVFELSREQGSVKAISDRYNSEGYADVSIRPVRSEDYENHTVDIDFVVEEGRKFYVGRVEVTGNSYTKTKVIMRELAILAGDPVDRNRIEVSKQRLMGMGYFDKVEATTVNGEALDEKDVLFKVQDKEDRYNVRVGAGASDVNGVFGMAELSCDNFDIADPANWFYGGGQRMRLQGILGIENAGFNADFVEPWLFDLPLRFELSGYMNVSEFTEWNEERIGVRTSLSHKIFDNFTTITAGYKFEHVNVTDIGHRLDAYMHRNDLNGGQYVSQPSLMIARDTRNSLTDPTSGYNVNAFGAISPKMLGSTNDFYRLELKGSYYYSFFDEAIVTMLGGQIGTVSAFKSGDSVPIFERYFLGGTGSLRGFDYRTVSPTVGHGNNIGGQTMLRLTAEVSHPIYGPLRGVAFVDAGNAWKDAYDMDFSGINVGAGYGLRMKLPTINVPVEIDLAYPIVNNQDYEPSKLRVHFNLGFTF